MLPRAETSCSKMSYDIPYKNISLDMARPDMEERICPSSMNCEFSIPERGGRLKEEATLEACNLEAT
nr:hypothetical protein [Tanacetum cinerariifolium]